MYLSVACLLDLSVDVCMYIPVTLVWGGVSVSVSLYLCIYVSIYLRLNVSWIYLWMCAHVDLRDSFVCGGVSVSVSASGYLRTYLLDVYWIYL